jgi:preprotein translocase subunit SecE
MRDLRSSASDERSCDPLEYRFRRHQFPLIFIRPAAASFATNMANPFRFLQEVRSEADKVTWPTRRETLVTTGLVIVLVIFTSLFFLAVDQSLRVLVGLILKIGH